PVLLPSLFLYTTLFRSYRFNRVDLSVGVRNLFDTYPDQPHSTRLVDPSDPSAGTAKDWNNNYGVFPWAAASPFGYNGRYVYVRLDRKSTRLNSSHEWIS